MRLVYISQAGIVERGWGHAVQIMNMCKAFADNGAEVLLISPKRNLKEKQDVFDFYSIPRNFKLVYLPCIDLDPYSPSKTAFFLRNISFYISARFYLLFKRFDFWYSRDFFAPLFFSCVTLELHSLPLKIKLIHKIAIRLTSKFTVLTAEIKNGLIRLGVKEDKVLISPDAVDLRYFTDSGDKIMVPGISPNDYVYGYAGMLKTMGMEKGVKAGIDALKFLPENYKFLIIGGEERDINFYKDYAKSVSFEDRAIFTGPYLYKDLPRYLKSCDALISPFPDYPHYRYFMSPLKIFEYMASKKPIIVSDLPTLREILDENKNALFIKPDSAEELALALKKLHDNPELSKHLSDEAYSKVEREFTWQKRAKRILDFLR